MYALSALRQRAAAVSGAVLAVALAGCLAACGSAPPGPPPEHLFLLVNGSATERQAGLSAGAAAMVRAAIDTNSATAQTVVATGGELAPSGPPLDLTPRRGDQIEHTPALRAQKGDALLARVADGVATAAGSSGRIDTLAQLTWLARQPGPATGVVIGSGLQTSGPLAIAALGWDQVGSDQVIAAARASGLLPDLAGKTVVLSGIGDVAGAQQPLPEILRTRLAGHWQKLCTAAGGRCSIDDEPLTGAPRSTVAAPVVAIPAEPAIVVPTAANPAPTVTELSSDLLFAPDSATLLPDATASLAELAGRLPAAARLTLDGRTATVGPAAGARDLSTARAEACRAALVAGGVPADHISVHGLGFDAPLVADLDAQGRLIPAAAQRNRSVTLTVAIGAAS